MSKLEYMVSIAFHLGRMENVDLYYDLDIMDIEDVTTLCGVILDEFYEQNEFSYLNEFLTTITDDYLNVTCERLFG